MKDFNVGVSDKLLTPWLQGREIIDCSDEGEAVAIAAGHYIATGHKANVFMSADGVMNALNFLTSWVIPEDLGMHLVVSIGRREPPHFIASDITEHLLANLIEAYGPKNLSYEFVRK